jgi:hypothetical protein
MNLFLMNFEDLPGEIVVLLLQEKMIILKYRLEMTFPTPRSPIFEIREIIGDSQVKCVVNERKEI